MLDDIRHLQVAAAPSKSNANKTVDELICKPGIDIRHLQVAAAPSKSNANNTLSTKTTTTNREENEFKKNVSVRGVQAKCRCAGRRVRGKGARACAACKERGVRGKRYM